MSIYDYKGAPIMSIGVPPIDTDKLRPQSLHQWVESLAEDLKKEIDALCDDANKATDTLTRAKLLGKIEADYAVLRRIAARQRRERNSLSAIELERDVL